MIKKMLLVFLCLSLFLSIPCCKKKLPTQPDIPVKIYPTIEHFTANPTSIKLDGSSTLSWSTKNATNITIDQGIGTVSAEATVDVSPEETTIYTLTATNSDGQKTASCTVEILQWAELDVSLNPEFPWFWWNPIYERWQSEFIIIMTETAGVGGQITSLIVTAWAADIMFYSYDFGYGSFNPFGSFSPYILLRLLYQPDTIIFGIEGVDENGYAIELVYWFEVIWFQSTGTMKLLKIVEGASHHKLIK